MRNFNNNTMRNFYNNNTMRNFNNNNMLNFNNNNNNNVPMAMGFPTHYHYPAIAMGFPIVARPRPLPHHYHQPSRDDDRNRRDQETRQRINGVQSRDGGSTSSNHPASQESRHRGSNVFLHFTTVDETAVLDEIGVRNNLGEEVRHWNPRRSAVNFNEPGIGDDDTFPFNIDELLGQLAELLSEDDDHGNDQDNGLREETIAQNLKTRIYQTPCCSSNSSNQDGDEICVVCQCEYENDERLGKLDCGHEYHEDCIKRWLLEKNVCPICKRAAIHHQQEEEESEQNN